MDAQPRWPLLDLFGAVLSGLCALHCVALPALMLGLPILGDHAFEWVLTAAIASVAVVAIGRGVARHGRRAVLIPLLTGLCALAIARAVGVHSGVGLAWSIAASALLVTAHLSNARYARAACTSRA